MEFMLPSFDMTKLRVVSDEASFPKGVLVMCHGLCEHLNRYDAVSEQLVAANFTIVRYDQRGHGKSEGYPAYFDDYMEMPKDMMSVVEWVRSEYPNLPIFIFGHSMGGLTAALFASHFPNQAQGFLLSGALTRYELKLLGNLPIDQPPKTEITNELGEGVCSKQEIIDKYMNDPMVRKTFTVGLCNACGKGVDYLTENPDKLVDPILIMHGANDGIVSVKDSLRLFDEIAAKDKGLRIYERLYHEILNEHLQQHILGEMIYWLENHL